MLVFDKFVPTTLPCRSHKFQTPPTQHVTLSNKKLTISIGPNLNFEIDV